jgi:hypothetical protein
MNNSESKPINNQSSTPSNPSPNSEKNGSTPQNKPTPQNVGGDQKNEPKKTDVIKENKDISSR